VELQEPLSYKEETKTFVNKTNEDKDDEAVADKSYDDKVSKSHKKLAKENNKDDDDDIMDAKEDENYGDSNAAGTRIHISSNMPVLKLAEDTEKDVGSHGGKGTKPESKTSYLKAFSTDEENGYNKTPEYSKVKADEGEDDAEKVGKENEKHEKEKEENSDEDDNNNESDAKVGKK
jgi:hypothetical protein